jgi:hypothetical protein
MSAYYILCHGHGVILPYYSFFSILLRLLAETLPIEKLRRRQLRERDIEIKHVESSQILQNGGFDTSLESNKW